MSPHNRTCPLCEAMYSAGTVDQWPQGLRQEWIDESYRAVAPKKQLAALGA